MSGPKLKDEFKRNAVGQVADRRYPVREEAERLGSALIAFSRTSLPGMPISSTK